MRSITSFNNAAVGSGTVVNQVLYEYDANGLLVRDFSNPNGAVQVASIPHIGYTYNATKSGEFFTRRLRPATMKYPSGKTLTYAYGTANSVDDLLGRTTAINEGTTSLVQYAYNGVATPMRTTYPQPNLALDYTVSGALDRFGRITDHAWRRSATDVVRIQHGYDRVGNRTHRRDVGQTTHSELYGYDGVNQVKSLNRGTLNAGNTAITASNFTETWNYDGTGNWLQYNRSGVVENRTHNPANEIQTNCTHDRNGNMTIMPGLRGVYDGWNRLVEARNASNVLIARYDYNGLNQRVRRAVGSVVTTSFFNAAWQELEAVTGGQATVNIWGQRYVDDLVLRERGNERLYSLADPNWNVVATTNASGTVQERMRYDAFGRITWLNAAFAVKAGTDFAWNRAFTGQVLDSETGMMLYRNRFYHTGLGRFVLRDPIGYEGKDVNVYRYVVNNSCNSTDAHGLQFDFSGDTRCTCERRLAQAREELERARPSAHRNLQNCNIDIQCTDECAKDQHGIDAMYWYVPDGTHIHICFKRSTAGDGTQRDFTALLIHEMVHIEQELRDRTTYRRFCVGRDNTTDFGDGDRPSPVFPTPSWPRYDTCMEREIEAYRIQGAYAQNIPAWRIPYDYLVRRAMESCAHLLPSDPRPRNQRPRW